MATSGIPSDERNNFVHNVAFFPSDKKEPRNEILGVTEELFFVNKPNSVNADKIGIATGEFIAQNADLATRLNLLKDQLVQKVTDVRISITYFQNWASTDAALLLHAKPRTREQVVNLVTAAKDLGIKMGIGGAYHSWSPLYPDSGGLLINICDLVLQDGRRIALNGERTAVTLSPGVTTGELMAFFLEHDVCFESDVILPTVTYGGVLSGGCHGVGKSQTSMSDWIKSMIFVDGKGQLRTIPDGIPSIPNLSKETALKAAQVNLGLFGVMVEVTVSVKPMVNAEVNNDFTFKLSMFNDPANEKLKELLRRYESVEMFWFPFNSIISQNLSLPKGDENPKVTLQSGITTRDLVEEQLLLPIKWNPDLDELWVRAINFPTEKPITDPGGIPVWSRIMDTLMGYLGGCVMVPLLSKLPCITPLFLTMGFQMLKLQYGDLQAEQVIKQPWAVHYRDGIDLMPVYDMEFAFPLDINNPTALTKAVKTVVKITEEYATQCKFPFSGERKRGDNCFPLSMCMEMRVMKKSTCLLCPASLGNEDYIAYVEVLSTASTQGYEQFFTDIAREWKDQGGVPHWNKQWTFLDKDLDIVKYLQGKYCTNLDTFKMVRKQLYMDPKNLFLNSTMAKVLNEQ